MGNRGNVKILYSEGQPIYLYTHWYGSELPKLVQDALRKKLRWNDEAYLARIIFDTMKSKSHDEECGFGIAPWIADNEHEIIEVNIKDQKIRTFNIEWKTRAETGTTGTYTFDEFCALDLKESN